MFLFLNEIKNNDWLTTPTNQIKELLKMGIASCEPVTEETDPPHIQAKRAYEHFSDNKKF